MATSDFERLVKAARRHIVEAGPKGIARSKLVTSAGVSGADPRQMTMVIDRLREANYIRDVGTAAGRGRRGERYVAAS